MKAKKTLSKLAYKDWIAKYFDKDSEHSYWTSNYERQEIGFAPSDLSRYREKDLKEEFKNYLDDTNTFIKYQECTNKLIEEDEDY